jgi:hypothetical protein
MARGRFITNEITKDKRINDLSNDKSRLAFTWLITFADSEGRTHGDPALVRSMLFPRRTDVTVEQIEACIREWADAGLIVWYEAEGDQWIYFPNFEKHQVGLRKDREPASAIPAPPEIPEPPQTSEPDPGQGPESGCEPAADPAEGSGSHPDNIRKDAGEDPDERRLKLIKENLIKDSGGKPPNSPALEPDPEPHPRKRSQKQTIRDELQDHFLSRTGLPAPRTGTKSEIKRAQALWWSPLSEIGELACWDVDTGREIIDEALKELAGLSVTDPNSIIKTARLVYARHNGGGTRLTLESQGLPYIGR